MLAATLIAIFLIPLLFVLVERAGDLAVAVTRRGRWRRQPGPSAS